MIRVGNLVLNDVNTVKHSFVTKCFLFENIYLASCDFEEDLCLWTNVHDSSDKFDWLRVRGSTSTQYTGPSADHTQGTISGYYIFIEINPPRQQGDNARLISQVCCLLSHLSDEKSSDIASNLMIVMFESYCFVIFYF